MKYRLYIGIVTTESSSYMFMLKSRLILNIVIGAALAVIVGLLLRHAWAAYEERADVLMEISHQELDEHLTHCAVNTAVERGYTTATLSGLAQDAIKWRPVVDRLRRKSDEHWPAVLKLAHHIRIEQHSKSDIGRTFANLMRQRAQFEQARQSARSSPSRGEAALFEWVATTTAYIEALYNLRGRLKTSVERLPTAQVATQALIAAEYAGRERAILAAAIASGRPVPKDVIRNLWMHRGVVESSLVRIRVLRTMNDLEPDLKKAILEALVAQTGAYLEMRDSIHAGTANGRYAVGLEQWLATATGTIDHLVVASQISQRQTMTKLHMQSALLERRMFAFSGAAFAAALLGLFFAMRLRRASVALYDEKELAEVTLHSIGEAVITTDSECRVRYLNPIAQALTGWTLEESRGLKLDEVFRIRNGVTGEPVGNPACKSMVENRVVGLENHTVLVARDGTERIIEDSAAPVRDREGRVVGAVLVFYDATAHTSSPNLLTWHATHDALTGLLNRREFERRLIALVKDSHTSGKEHVLIYIDLDQFKVINDTFGHVVGDRLLRQLAFLLVKEVSEGETLARLGGDEFGLLIQSPQREDVARRADKLLELIRHFRFIWNEQAFQISASIGAVSITPDSGTPVELLSRADAACFAAKEHGRDRVRWYKSGDAELDRRRAEMGQVTLIQDAVRDDRFVLYGQLVVPVKENGSLPHCEILVRMLDTEGNIVMPGDFIPSAERYNLMGQIDRWIIHHALTIFAERNRSGQEDELKPGWFLNISAASLADPYLPEFIRKEIEARGIEPGRICFEITETAAMSHLESAVEFLQALKKIGCNLALDDFGSGMSSFGYLKLLPVDYLKIDGSFVRTILENPTDRALVGAIHSVGVAMGLKTIAEFVENKEILAELQLIGVDYAQGWGIARPVPLSDLTFTRSQQI